SSAVLASDVMSSGGAVWVVSSVVASGTVVVPDVSAEVSLLVGETPAVVSSELVPVVSVVVVPGDTPVESLGPGVTDELPGVVVVGLTVPVELVSSPVTGEGSELVSSEQPSTRAGTKLSRAAQATSLGRKQEWDGDMRA